jgi:hypothetical protein
MVFRPCCGEEVCEVGAGLIACAMKKKKKKKKKTDDDDDDL